MKINIFYALLFLVLSTDLVLAQTIVGPPNEGDVNVLYREIASASPGDTLVLQEGIYEETRTIETSSGDLTIRGADGAEVIVYGPTGEEANMMHVKSRNLWLKNLIFIGSDSSRNCIVNYYGGVSEAGGEKDADKNNIYISNCQFYVFPENAILLAASTDWDNEVPYADDGMFHPVDTLRILDCYFYGADVTDERAIITKKRQVHYVEVRRSTFWSLGQDAIEIQGYWIGSWPEDYHPQNDPNYITVIADHVTIYNTFNNSPNRPWNGGDGIHFEYVSANSFMSNSIVFRTGRFCFKAKRGYASIVCAYYCIGDSMNVPYPLNYPLRAVYYRDMCQDPTSIEGDPLFIDSKNGNFGLDPTSPAIGTADPNSLYGPNRGDPHWNDPNTHWATLAEINSLIAKVRLWPLEPSDTTGINIFVSIGFPTCFVLSQNYPNPFNSSTKIAYTLPETGLASLKIYNIQGQLIRTLVDEYQGSGEHTVLWDGLSDYGQEATSGIYVYYLGDGNEVRTRKMMLLR